MSMDKEKFIQLTVERIRKLYSGCKENGIEDYVCS